MCCLKCSKSNHSISYLIPAFSSFAKETSIVFEARHRECEIVRGSLFDDSRGTHSRFREPSNAVGLG